ncbi:MAG TPA: DUF3291 domain-containing protein [Kofleriaceae bacterium]|nr:DUF3291 domain-containing protein [Kofleriaceae bacterium]
MSTPPTPTWYIAQLNVSRPLAPLTSPRLADFVAQLDEINALAEAAPGFVWRLKSEAGNATDIQVAGDPELIVNLTVWRTVDELFEFVFRTGHTQVMVRRREWFERPTEPMVVLWWIAAGEVPTLDEAMARLRHLRAHGPTPHAFTFKQRYPAPPAFGPPVDMKPEPYCAP